MVLALTKMVLGQYQGQVLVLTKNRPIICRFLRILQTELLQGKNDKTIDRLGSCLLMPPRIYRHPPTNLSTPPQKKVIVFGE